MSRRVNLNQPLSDEDRAYLVMMGRNDLITQNEINFSEYDESLEKKDDGNTGDVDQFSHDDGSDLLAGTHPQEIPSTDVQAVEVGKVPGEPEPTPQATETSLPEASEDDEDDEEDNYDDESVWSYADLQAEAKSREPAVNASGNRAEVIARLREDDAS